MEKYEAPKLEVINMQDDVILCYTCSGDFCDLVCGGGGDDG